MNMTLYENAFFFFKNVLLFHRLLLVLHLVLQLIPLLLFSFLTFFFLVMFSCRSPPLSTVSSFIFKRPFISVFFSVLLSFGFPFLFNVLPCSLFVARSLSLSLSLFSVIPIFGYPFLFLLFPSLGSSPLSTYFSSRSSSRSSSHSSFSSYSSSSFSPFYDRASPLS